MKPYNLVAMATLMLMTTACHHAPQSTGIRIADLDTTVNPSDNFYQFATGGWQKANPIPGEYARYGSFESLGQQNLEQVNTLITELAATSHEHGTIAQKIGDIYNLAMDTARRNQEGVQPIMASVEKIGAIQSKDELSRALGESTEYGLFGMYIDADAKNSSMNILYESQGGYNLEREYYLQDDERSRQIRAEYLKYIERIFAAYGFIDGDLAAPLVLRLETRLARAARSKEQLRDPQANYNMMSVSQLQTLVPEINWTEFLTAANLQTDSLCVGQPEQLQEVGRMLAEESLSDLKTLFIWQTLDGAHTYLNDEFFNAGFDFYGQVLSGTTEPTPLWKRAVNIVDGTLGEAVGEMYVNKYFPAANKQRMLQLVHNLQAALAERIQALEWMSDKTKQKALEKLQTMDIKIGYPDKWRDYSNLDIDPTLSYYENIQRAVRFEMAYNNSFLNQPVDKSKWYMFPQTVNAYYNPSSNEICFPAAILQYPFFDMSADDAFNYGAIGVVIGHEMTHGFDDQGCQFDKVGNLENWWTEEDKTRFDARTEVMKNYFDQIEVAPGLHANGTFTLGENIADHGGLQISFQAFTSELQRQGKDPFVVDQASADMSFTPAQRFFLSYAHVWAANIRDEEVVRRTQTDPHSLGKWRVNGALPHIAAWYQAWDIDESSPMYLAPDNRVSIW